MPIRVPDGLPAAETLHDEGVKVMRESRAAQQDIRPLRIAILNLMPLKIATETQLATNARNNTHATTTDTTPSRQAT